MNDLSCPLKQPIIGSRRTEYSFTTITTDNHGGATELQNPGDTVYFVVYVNGLCDHDVTGASGVVQLGSWGSCQI